MKKSRFVATITKGAVASTIVGACLVPQSHSAPNIERALPSDVAIGDTGVQQRAEDSVSNESYFIAIPNSVSAWTSDLEREFRNLALLEAKGIINKDGMRRLEELTTLRNRLKDPLSSAEILFQLKRDRILEKMAEALNEYVKFYETANQKGHATFETH